MKLTSRPAQPAARHSTALSSTQATAATTPTSSSDARGRFAPSLLSHTAPSTKRSAAGPRRNHTLPPTTVPITRGPRTAASAPTASMSPERKVTVDAVAAANETGVLCTTVVTLSASPKRKGRTWFAASETWRAASACRKGSSGTRRDHAPARSANAPPYRARTAPPTSGSERAAKRVARTAAGSRPRATRNPARTTVATADHHSTAGRRHPENAQLGLLNLICSIYRRYLLSPTLEGMRHEAQGRRAHRSALCNRRSRHDRLLGRTERPHDLLGPRGVARRAPPGAVLGGVRDPDRRALR